MQNVHCYYTNKPKRKLPQAQLTTKGKVIRELKWEKNGLIYPFKSKTKMLQNVSFVKVQCVQFLCHNVRQQYVVLFIKIQLNHLELTIKIRL